MKKLLFSFASLAITLTTNASVLTVNNTSTSAGQYTSVQTAITAAVAGDTIYVHGSATTYGDVTIDKRLVIIGAGYQLSGTQYNLPSKIEYLTLNLASGTIIKGMNILGIQDGGFVCNNITIERNFISAFLYVSGSAWIIKNNFAGSIRLDYDSNIIISNNIIAGVYGIMNSDKPSVLITNNIFLTQTVFYALTSATITNNFFFEANFFLPTAGNPAINNVYRKNIFIHTVATNFMSLPAENLNTVSPQFVSIIPSATDILSAQNLDWHLLASSLGKVYGTDGTDIGIYGGTYPMPNTSGLCPIPQILNVDIQNPNIPINGTLNVDFKARKQK